MILSYLLKKILVERIPNVRIQFIFQYVLDSLKMSLSNKMQNTVQMKIPICR